MPTIEYDLRINMRRAAIVRFGTEDNINFFKVLQSATKSRGDETDSPVVICSSNRVYIDDVNEWVEAVRIAATIASTWENMYTGKPWVNDEKAGEILTKNDLSESEREDIGLAFASADVDEMRIALAKAGIHCKSDDEIVELASKFG